LVISTEIVAVCPAFKLNPVKLTVPEPAVAVTTPPVPPVITILGVDATLILLGRLSVNAIPDCVTASEAVLVIVHVYLATPPSMIVVGDNV
jgi:hypothetical protein